jgi:hypothetical protein
MDKQLPIDRLFYYTITEANLNVERVNGDYTTAKPLLS